MTGARCFTGTSTSVAARRRRRPNTTRPPAARTLRTHSDSPARATRYPSPSCSSSTRLVFRITPDLRPGTSRVTTYLGLSPSQVSAKPSHCSLAYSRGGGRYLSLPL
jgi:hypothetical protein